MPHIKNDFFCRGVRMQHVFGELAQNSHTDPLGGLGTFELKWPKRPSDLSAMAPSPPLSVQTHGQYGYRKEPSAVQKPNGRLATIDGPRPDVAQAFAMPIPVGTKRRLGPLKTDK